MFANIVTIAAADTGYKLSALLAAVGADLPSINRVACLKISQVSGDAYLVPNDGTIVTTTGDVPDQYGWSFSSMGTWFEMSYPSNVISLDDLILAGAAGSTLAVYGYAI
jgi:hypothetical protein